MATVAPTRPSPGPRTRLRHVLGKLALAIVLISGLMLLLLALAGVFRSKVSTDKGTSTLKATDDLPLAVVRLLRRPRYETAVGTVKPVHETAVASKLLARVVEVKVKAGQTVTRNEVLVRLDDADLQARLKQAEAALAAAKSSYDHASTDYKRAQQLLEGKAIARAEYDRFETAFRTATAELERAQQAVREAKVLLDYATIRAPMTGIVIDKRVEAGDTVGPGQVLLTLYDPTRMQMVVTVRESLAQRLAVGQKVRGRLEALKHDCEATISEIVPEAQAASRSFTVKVTGPCPPGVYSGMFGRIFIPLEEEELVVVPAAAVFKVGQLDMVDVVAAGTIRRRSVQLGRKLDQDYEVLAGLKPGEKVVLPKDGKEAG
jgi:membrane fusion protein (multidrug efflux system)